MLVPGPRAVMAMAAGAPVAAVAGLAVDGLWLAGPAWVAAVLVLVAIDALLCRRATTVGPSPDLPSVIEVGRDGAVAFRFGGQPPPGLEAVLEADERLEVRSLPDEDAAVFRFVLRPRRRGTGVLHALHLRWFGPLHLVRRSQVRRLEHPVLVTPQISRVREEAMRWFSRERAAGRARVHDIAAGGEFHALRAFQPGDNRGAVDWRRSARHAGLLVRDTEAERNRTILLAIDTGRLMSEPLSDGMCRLDHALHAALVLAFSALRLGDRVGLYGFGARPVLFSGILSGASAFGPLQRLAATLDYSTEETNFTLGLTGLAAELSARAMVVVFTDFVDPTGAELMLDTVARLLRRHAVIFVVQRDEMLEALVDAPPNSADDVARSVVADTLLTRRDAVLARLRRMGVDVVETGSRAAGAALVARYLDRKRRDVP